MMKNLIIGIGGKPGTGKDTLAHLFECHSTRFTRMSLADIIRDISSVITGLTMEQLRSHQYKDKELEDFDGATPRELTIKVGRAIESSFGEPIWTKILQRRIFDQSVVNVVVPDIRTVQQANWIKENNGLLINIDSDITSEYEIENRLNDYDRWDYIINKDLWFADKESEFVKACSALNIPCLIS